MNVLASGARSAAAAARPLRIGHVVDCAYGEESANGVRQVVHCLVRAQSDVGQSVAVFAGIDGMHVPRNGAASAADISAPRAAGSGSSHRDRLIPRYLDRTFVERVLAWKPDVVHFHSVHVPLHVMVASYLRRAGIPYCVTVHGALFPAALQRSRLKKAVFQMLVERRFLNGARFVHAVSPHEVGAIRSYGVGCPVVIVPNGLPPDAKTRPSRPDALYAENPRLRERQVFMFIGRLDPWQKGLDLLIEAFARAGLRDAALVLVGPDWRRSRHSLEALADRLDVLSHVVFAGPAFGEDRANFLAAADVFVHLSRWEGLSLSVLAAAAAGKPCLVTREADPLGELERAQGALIVEPTVPSAADGLRRSAALSGHELQLMGARARAATERFCTWPTIATALIDAYSSIMKTDDRAVADQPHA